MQTKQCSCHFLLLLNPACKRKFRSDANAKAKAGDDVTWSAKLVMSSLAFYLTIIPFSLSLHINERLGIIEFNYIKERTGKGFGRRDNDILYICIYHQWKLRFRLQLKSLCIGAFIISQNWFKRNEIQNYQSLHFNFSLLRN